MQIAYKRDDSTLYMGWDFTPELPTGVALTAESNAVIHNDAGEDVTSSLLESKAIIGNEIVVYIKKGGTNLTDYEVFFKATTTDAKVSPTHSVIMKVRNSG